MKKNPGQLIQTPDGRKYIMYNEQPLFVTHDKIILYHIDQNFKPIYNDKGKSMMRLLSPTEYESMEKKLIGYCD